MSTLSDAYRENPLALPHIIPLDFHSVESLPESHVWPSQLQPNECSLSGGKQTSLAPSSSVVPIIDLNMPNVVEHVGHACQMWGMFQVTNHGVSHALLADVEHQTRKLFSLPAYQKIKALRSFDGATGYGTARIAPFFSKYMWHEGFTIMGSSASYHAMKLWPQEYQHFCDVMEDYQKKMKALSYKILLLILKWLDISEEEMNWASPAAISKSYEQQSQDALQLNSYPSCPDPNRAIGLAPHTDSLLLTILHQSNTNGLQVFKDDGGGDCPRWVPVPPVPGALIVNIGDLFHIFSNAEFPTVRHRVMVSQSKHRISVAYFYSPPLDSRAAPFSKYESPRYRSLTVKEYLSIKAKHLDKALSFVRI